MMGRFGTAKAPTEVSLRQAQGSATAAAKLLGVSRSAVYRLSRRYELDFPAFRE